MRGTIFWPIASSHLYCFRQKIMRLNRWVGALGRVGLLWLGSGSQVLFPLCEKTNVRSNCRKVYPPPLLVWPNRGRRVPASPGQVARGCLQSADWVRCSSRHLEFDAAPARLHGKSAAVSRDNIFINIFNFPEFYFSLQMLVSSDIYLARLKKNIFKYFFLKFP